MVSVTFVCFSRIPDARPSSSLQIDRPMDEKTREPHSFRDAVCLIDFDRANLTCSHQSDLVDLMVLTNSHPFSSLSLQLVY
jgi:hypothetical protein